MFCSLKSFYKALILTVALCVCACSSQREFDRGNERTFFGVAARQLPPQPVYNRLRLAYLPEPMPSSAKASYSETRLSPIFQFEIDDATLEQAGRILGDMARYSSYTSSSIADQKISLAAVGTIDEVAKQLSESAGIKVVVDHRNKEVRLLANLIANSKAALPEETKIKPDAEVKAKSLLPVSPKPAVKAKKKAPAKPVCIPSDETIGS